MPVQPYVMWQLDIRLKLLLALMIGVFMGALDLTILAPALSSISSSFGVTPAALALAFSLYAACYAIAVPLMSKLADVRGYKIVYGTSMALFAVGSMAAALAPTLPLLIVARAVQGIGGGGLFPVAQAIVGAVLPEEKRGRALGLLLGTFALGGVLGPNLGGFLAQHASWHWIFWINVPLGVLGVLLLLPIDLGDEKRDVRIDWAGAVLVAVALGSLVLGIESLRTISETGLFNARTTSMLVLAVLSFGLLIPLERRTPEPILDLNLIASASIAPLLMVSMLVGYALLSGAIFVPIYTQVTFGASAFGAGAVLNAAALGLGISSWISGAYMNKIGAKRLVILGMGATAAGLGGMILLQSHLWGILGALVFLGAGVGLAQGPISFLGLALAPGEDRGQISGLIAITRSMGGALGITLSGVLLSDASRVLNQQMAGSGLANLTNEAWGSSGGLEALRQAPAAAQEMVRTTLGAGIIEGWYWALGAAALGLFFSFWLQNQESSDRPQRRFGW